MERKRMAVSGMSCTGCEQRVENALRALDGVTRVEADHEGGSVEVVVADGTTDDELASTIRDAGYDVAT